MDASFQPIRDASRRGCRGPARPGVVMVVTLIALVLLASLVMYVLNLGRQVTAKVDTQNAADAAAVAGAGWVARSMNNVALNNVGMAQLIAAVNVLDSMPQAIDFSIRDNTESAIGDETAMYLATIHQLQLGVPPADDVFRRELVRTRDIIGPPENATVGSDEWMLADLNNVFKANPETITNATFFNPPDGTPTSTHGTMWQAMESLTEYNRALLDGMGAVAKLHGEQGGQANRADKAYLIPVAEDLGGDIMREGVFQDFQRPVRYGLLPDASLQTLAVDSSTAETLYRGPYDAVYGWRNMDGNTVGGSHSNPHGMPGYVVPTSFTPTRYRVFGPHEWMLRKFDDQTVYGRLGWHLRRIANIKLGYLWPNKRNESDPNTLGKLVDPDWEIDIERDNERSTYSNLTGLASGDQDAKREKLDASGNPIPLCQGHTTHATAYAYASEPSHRTGARPDIHESLFLVLNIHHVGQNNPFNAADEYPGNQASPTWYIYGDRSHNRRIHRWFLPGWRDPSQGSVGRMRANTTWRGYTGNPVGVPPQASGPPGFYDYRQLGNGRYMWKEVAEFWTDPTIPSGRYANGAYPEIGLQAIQIGVDSVTGMPIYRSQQFFITQWFLFVGVNVGMEKVVRDPYIGFYPDTAAYPKPMHLIPKPDPEDTQNTGWGDSGNRRQLMTFLGVAERNDHAPMWSRAFRGGKPYEGRIVGMAQARVFNNHSWDLWTQMWHAQMEPITQFDDWVDRCEQAANEDNGYADLAEFMRATSGLAEIMLAH